MRSVRACPACPEARPAERYEDPLCAVCMPAAREAVPGTFTWPFDSPLMRRVLAERNMGAVPAVFRAAAGLSLDDVAPLVGWSRHSVGSYERGKRGALHDERAFGQFAEAVDLPYVAMLPYLFRDPAAALAGDRVLEALLEALGVDVDRRGFGGLAAGTAAAALLPEVSVPARVTASHIRYLEACVSTLISQDRKVGGAAVLRSGLRVWQRARRMLAESRYTDTIESELLWATGDLALCAGQLARDSGNFALARQLYSEAQTLADKAGDTVLTVHALTGMSDLSYDMALAGHGMKHARDALLIANQAADVARRYPMPRLHAAVAAMHADAAYQLGDVAAFQSAVTRMRREFDRGPRAGDPVWVQYVSDAMVTVFEARSRASQGDLDAVAVTCRTSLDDAALSPRNSALRRAKLATALANGRDITSAVSEGMTVLSVLEGGVTSVRTLNELRPVRLAAATSKKPAAKDFRTRFDKVNQALTAA
jgi:hypothetical protein